MGDHLRQVGLLFRRDQLLQAGLFLWSEHLPAPPAGPISKAVLETKLKRQNYAIVLYILFYVLILFSTLYSPIHFHILLCILLFVLFYVLFHILSDVNSILYFILNSILYPVRNSILCSNFF